MPACLPQPVPADALRWTCDPVALGFQSTAELSPLDAPLGQHRAMEAIRLAIGVRHPGYNLFALGTSGVGKHHLVEGFLARHAERCAAARDWCYLHPLGDGAPVALGLPAGQGLRLRDEAAALVVELQEALAAAFEGEDYLARRQELHEAAEAAEAEAFAQVDALAQEHELAVVRSAGRVMLQPLKEGETIAAEAFDALPAQEREAIEARLAALEEPVREAMVRLPALRRRAREALEALDTEVSTAAVSPAFVEVTARWEQVEVRAWLERLRQDVVANAHRLLPEEESEDEDGPLVAAPELADEDGWADLRRYRVHVLVSHSPQAPAPVVREDDPSLGNLFGRIEYVSSFGALSTDFLRIRAGALHRANGGFLVLDARRLVEEPLSWEYLKQALRRREIRLPTPGLSGSVVTTVTLEPEPIPLELKVVLVGERELYYLLSEADPQFDRLFKIAADFEDDMVRDAGTVDGSARLLATLVQEHGLRPLSAAAVARVLEHSVRLADDQQRLSTHVDALADLLRESDYCAALAEHPLITAEDVHAALAARRIREGRLEERALHAVLDGTVRVPTEGSEIGEVNGLALFEIGRSSFGQPLRVGARVRLGEGEIVDIEHEVELGGPIHSKGVKILVGFLGGRFGKRRPLSFTATVAFEQSYGEVDGDSASLAETCALLSALAELPLRQDLALTASVDQRGRVQAVGGVSDKVEGWYDLCAARGLTGTQGVIVPRSSLRALQLRPDVVQAAREGSFSVYAVDHVDQAIALLTGVPAGRRTRGGGWTRGSVNERVAARLEELGELARKGQESED